MTYADWVAEEDEKEMLNHQSDFHGNNRYWRAYTAGHDAGAAEERECFRRSVEREERCWGRSEDGFWTAPRKLSSLLQEVVAKEQPPQGATKECHCPHCEGIEE